MRDYSFVRDSLLDTCERFAKSVARRKDKNLVDFSINMLNNINEFINISELRESNNDMILDELTFRDVHPSKAEKICKLFGVNYLDSIDEQDLSFMDGLNVIYSPKTFFDDFNAYRELMNYRSLNKDFYSEIPKSRKELYLELDKSKLIFENSWEKK
jgi:hypothetical protein